MTETAKFNELLPIEEIIYLSASPSYRTIGSPDSFGPKSDERLAAGVAGDPSKLKNLNDEFQDAK